VSDWDAARAAAARIERATSLRPEIAVVLGSGLGALADDLQDGVTIPYHDIPHFPVSTAPTHRGMLAIGRMAGRPVAMMVGRVHLYEGYSAHHVAFPVRALRALGIRYLVLTNAAGGINPHLTPGTLMLIADHINMTGHNPLVGPNDDRLGPRFPDMTEVYDRALRDLARQVARVLGVTLVEGVYLGLGGPSFETPAEIRMARTLGADAVGMSTVIEAIAARHAGLRLLGLSVITNLAAGLGEAVLSEAEVVETAARVRGNFTSLIEGIVRGIDTA